jgi:divalent metal cation (Fe/Co/Zn/Cd) transporter
MNKLKKERMQDNALKVAYFNVAYHIIEGIVSILFGIIAGSIALIGFGLDSFVELMSGTIIIWRFTKHRELSEKEAMQKEMKAIKMISYSFFVLAAYILYESASKLYLHDKPDPTIVGIVISLISIVVMTVLFRFKQKIGLAIKSKSIIVDSKQTLACIYLSIALFVGLGLNYLIGFWQADPIVGILIAFFLIKEGICALKEDEITQTCHSAQYQT